MPRLVARRGEEGIAMVTVLTLAALMFGMAVLFATRSVSDLDQATDARAREGALHVGESGVDDALAKVVATPTFNTGDAGAAACVALTSISAERSCIKAIADAAPDTASPSTDRVVDAAGGQWVAVKPAAEAVVYAVGYVPNRAAPLRVRVVRVKYDFAPLAPQTALLTDGDLDLTGSTSLQGVLGSSHANGNTDITGGSFTADGFIASSGTLSGNTSGVDDCQAPPAGTSCANTGGGHPRKTVPQIVPREQYRLSEYDLCVSGTTGVVKPGPAHETSPNRGPDGVLATEPGTGLAINRDEVPCASTTVLATLDSSTPSWNGWEYSPASGGQWRYNSNTAFAGSYYVVQRPVLISGSPGSTASPWEVTITVDCTNPTDSYDTVVAGEAATHSTHGACDVELRGAPQIRPSVKGYPFVFVVGRDVKMRGTGNTTDPSRIEGAILAHEQFSLGGNTDYLGAVVSNGTVDTASSPVPENELFGNARVTFDGNLELPFGKTIRITHWQEL